MVIWWVIICVVATISAHDCRAQSDDFDGQWLTPTLDALERYREDPLCLRCATPTSLTQIPGISKRMASRIVAACQSATMSSLEHLADSVCASPEQFLLLNACTTLTCTCVTFVRTLRARVRSRSSITPLQMMRIDATHAFGIAGTLVQHTSERTTTSAWLTATISEIDISLGDIALLSGSGLLLGTGRTLVRRGVDILPSTTPLVATRPWPSIAFDHAPRGIVGQWRSTTLPLALGVSAWIDRTSSSSDVCSALHLETHIANVDVLTTFLRGSGDVRSRDALSLTLSHQIEGIRLVGEVCASRTAIDGMQLFAGYSADRCDVVAAAWAYSPTATLRYGLSALGTTHPRNDRGLHVAVHQRFSTHLSAAASITMNERITRTYLDPLPPQTTDLRCELEVRPVRLTLVRLRLAHRRSVASISTPDGRQMAVSTSPQLRLDCESTITRSVRVRGRIELRGERLSADSTDLCSLVSFMCRLQLTRSLTLSAQVVQWRASSYDVAPRMSTLGVPGTFDLLVCTDVGVALHMQARWELPYNINIAAHLRHELRQSQVTTQWTVQAEWHLARTDQRSERVGFVHEMVGD